MEETPVRWMEADSAGDGPSVLVLAPRDDVGVALRQLNVGDPVVEGCVATASIPRGHKVALHDIAPGDRVSKYGQTIGYASENVPGGAHVHVHNLAFSDSKVDHDFASFVPENPQAAPDTFQGLSLIHI